MKIAILMRAMDQDSGFQAVVDGYVSGLLSLDQRNEYLLLYRTDKFLGRYASYPNVKEVLVQAPGKLAWDQLAVPWRAWVEGADVIFNPKFTVPLVRHCPAAMGLQEPAWWVWPQHYESKNVRAMRMMLPIFVRSADHLFPNSQFILDENRKCLRMPLANADVAYSASGPQFQPIADRQELEKVRAELDLPERFILNLTRVTHPGLENSTAFHAGKNPETALRAFMQIRDAVPHELVVIGRRIRDYVDHLGFQAADLERVQLREWVPFEKLHYLYNLAELIVIPSHYEGCPNVLLQAMSCGGALVVSKTGGCPDVAGDCALFADPEDPSDFAAQMKRALESSALRQELRKKSLERGQFFSWEKSARTILQALSRLAASSARDQ